VVQGGVSFHPGDSNLSLETPVEENATFIALPSVDSDNENAMS
jgi:hypothetical protein